MILPRPVGGRAILWGHEALFVDIQPAPHMAGCFIENWTSGAWRVTLLLVDHTPAALAYALRGSGLGRRASDGFGECLPLLRGVGARGRAEQNDQGSGQPRPSHIFLHLNPAVFFQGGKISALDSLNNAYSVLGENF